MPITLRIAPNEYFRGYVLDMDKVPKSPGAEKVGREYFDLLFSCVKDDKNQVHAVFDEDEQVVAMMIKARGSKEEVQNRPITPLEGPAKECFKEVTIPKRYLGD